MHSRQNRFISTRMGRYDMAVGKKVTSAFSGPADVNSFDLISHLPSSKTIKAKHSAERDDLEILYQTVRNKSNQ
jgi:phenylalanine-4-hydroxylase